MDLNNISGCNLIALSSSISILLSENLSTDEINSLSAFFSAIGDNLAIIANQRSDVENN